jgi:hypothetical protein
MSLSIAPLERWDFQKAVNPLVGEVAAHTLTNNNATLNTTDGLVVDAAATYPGLRILAPPGTLIPTFPFTLVTAATFPETSRSMNFGTIIGYSNSDSVFTGIAGDFTPNADPSAVVQFNVPSAGGWNQSPYGAATVAEGAQVVLVAEFTTTTRKLWVNGTLTVNQSGTFSVIPTADFHINVRGNGVWMIDFTMPFCAVFDDVLTAGDITELGSSYSTARDALFGASGPAFRSYYITG